MSKIELDKTYWSKRYQNKETGWDIGEISTPLKEYFDQLTNKKLKILIPGAGNSYEAEYLFNLGFNNVFVVDLASEPLQNFKKRVPHFPSENLIQGDFFDLNDKFDLMVEQTFFCAIDPILRKKYVKKAKELLSPKGKVAGVLFGVPLNTDHPPFGGNIKEYESLFSPHFNIKKMEKAYNSIAPRNGGELFIILEVK